MGTETLELKATTTQPNMAFTDLEKQQLKKKKKILDRFNIKLENREEKIFELKKRAIELSKFEYQWGWGRLKQQ